jgi:hypothetical protein
MGAWGFKNFENDSASDWLYYFSEKCTLKFLLKTIKAVQKEKDYLDSDVSSECLAAIESIAIIKGVSSEDIEELEEVNIKKVEKELNQDIYKECIISIDRILSKENNELYELWEESESFEDWKKEVEYLRDRIRTVILK